MPFKGTPAPGGARKGAGRKPSEFLERCRRIASSPKYFAWAERLISDEATEERVMPDGSIIKVRASAGDKDRVWSSLAAYGFGKPAQPINVEGDGMKRILLVVPSDAKSTERPRFSSHKTTSYFLFIRGEIPGFRRWVVDWKVNGFDCEGDVFVGDLSE